MHASSSRLDDALVRPVRYFSSLHLARGPAGALGPRPPSLWRGPLRRLDDSPQWGQSRLRQPLRNSSRTYVECRLEVRREGRLRGPWARLLPPEESHLVRVTRRSLDVLAPIVADPVLEPVEFKPRSSFAGVATVFPMARGLDHLAFLLKSIFVSTLVFVLFLPLFVFLAFGGM